MNEVVARDVLEVELALWVTGPETVLELVVLPPVGPTEMELVVELAL